MKILLIALALISTMSFGAKNISNTSQINCFVTDGAGVDKCVMVVAMGSTDDPIFGRSVTVDIPLNAGQLTALSAIVSAGVAEVKSQKNIP